MTKYNIPFSPPDITEAEIAEVADTLRSGWITTGPKTKELERRLSVYTQTPKTVCLNSATAALELILRVLEVGPGDEVIVPAMTYTASCSVITHVGATPGPTSKTRKINSRAAVAELRQTVLGVCVYWDKRRSSSFVFGPVVIQPERRVSATSAISASVISGGENGIL